VEDFQISLCTLARQREEQQRLTKKAPTYSRHSVVSTFKLDT